MKVELKTFGELLISRPAGRECFLAFRAYGMPEDPNEIIELDFDGVAVVAPSWLHEFVLGLEESGRKVIYLPTNLASARMAIEVIESNEP